jgi:hypothetical protein
MWMIHQGREMHRLQKQESRMWMIQQGRAMQITETGKQNVEDSARQGNADYRNRKAECGRFSKAESNADLGVTMETAKAETEKAECG